MLEEIIGDLPAVSNNQKLLAKFHSGILRIMRLISLFSIIAQTPVGILLKQSRITHPLQRRQL